MELLWILLLLPLCSANNTDINFVGLFPITGDWPLGTVLEAGARLAIQDISNHPVILKNLPGGDYTLKMWSNDTQCTAGVGVRLLVAQVTTFPPKIGIVGPGCSGVSIAVADLAKYWNLNMISFANTPVLSDKKIYSDFWRIQPNDNFFANTWISLGKLFGWKRFFAIREDNSLFNKPIGHFQETLQNLSWTLAASEVFPPDFPAEIESHVSLLKSKGARIIVGGFYEGNCRRVLCHAWKLGLSWRQGVIWILPGWFNDGWQTPTPEELSDPTFPCTTAEMVEATQYLIQTTAIGFASDSIGILPWVGELPSQWKVRWEQYRATKDPLSTDLYWGPLAYDSMWVWALALHEYLKTESLPSLETYNNLTATDLLQEQIRALNFSGVSGVVRFDTLQDRPLPIAIELTVGGVKQTVGVFENDLINMVQAMIWPDGSEGMENTPPDQKISKYDIPVAVQAPLLAFAAVLLVSLGVLLGYVWYHRESEVIKATSPKFNYCIIVGSIITAVAGVLYLVDLKVDNPAMCCFRLYLPTFGVIFMFSPLVVKTYRVYRIFNNPELRKLTHLKDPILLKGVAFMLTIQIAFTIISIGAALPEPQLVDSKSLSSSSETVRVVECTTSPYFIVLVLVYLSLLVLYGLYLAVATRNVPDKYNESRYIAFTITFYLVYGLIIFPLQLLATDPTSLAVLRGFGILLGVAISVGAMFVPKILNIATGGQPVNFFAYVSSRIHTGPSKPTGPPPSNPSNLENVSRLARESISQLPSIEMDPLSKAQNKSFASLDRDMNKSSDDLGSQSFATLPLPQDKEKEQNKSFVNIITSSNVEEDAPAPETAQA